MICKLFLIFSRNSENEEFLKLITLETFICDKQNKISRRKKEQDNLFYASILSIFKS